MSSVCFFTKLCLHNEWLAVRLDTTERNNPHAGSADWRTSGRLCRFTNHTGRAQNRWDWRMSGGLFMLASWTGWGRWLRHSAAVCPAFPHFLIGNLAYSLRSCLSAPVRDEETWIATFFPRISPFHSQDRIRQAEPRFSTLSSTPLRLISYLAQWGKGRGSAHSVSGAAGDSVEAV